MRNFTAALYSVIVYLIFFVTFLYAMGFTQEIVVPKSINSGVPGDLLPSLLIDAALLSVFAIQHSVMARPAFKRAWTKIVPHDAERSTYVLAASLALILVFWQWRPITQSVWAVDNPSGAALLTAIGYAGWGLVLISTFLISHFQLFGLSQGFSRMLGLKTEDMAFSTPSLYRYLRHPIYAGFIIAFWGTPNMTLGHLLFAVATTGYIFIGIWFEERDLIAQFGDRYRLYKREVGMLIPRPGKRAQTPEGIAQH